MMALRTAEATVRHKDGSLIEVGFSISPIQWDDGQPAVIGLAEDAVLAPVLAGQQRDRLLSAGLVALVGLFGGFIVLLLLQVMAVAQQMLLLLRYATFPLLH